MTTELHTQLRILDVSAYTEREVKVLAALLPTTLQTVTQVGKTAFPKLSRPDRGAARTLRRLRLLQLADNCGKLWHLTKGGSAVVATI